METAPRMRATLPTKHLIGYLVVALAALGIGAYLRGHEPGPTTGVATVVPAVTAPVTAPGRATSSGAGRPVRDGGFAFDVISVRRGVQRVGTGDSGATADGRYVLVDLTVTNISDEPETLERGFQTVSTDDDREFSPDVEAAAYLKGAGAVFHELEPGHSVRGVIAFDVPEAARPVRLTLHGSPTGEGTRVPFGQ